MVTYGWRGGFTTGEVDALHAEAFDTRVHADAGWDWQELVDRHGLGWVVARDGSSSLLGFVNDVWDGLVHAWVQDTMVARTARNRGVGRRLIAEAKECARPAGCDRPGPRSALAPPGAIGRGRGVRSLRRVRVAARHLDDGLEGSYVEACGFPPTRAGLKRLR